MGSNPGRWARNGRAGAQIRTIGQDRQRRRQDAARAAADNPRPHVQTTPKKEQ